MTKITAAHFHAPKSLIKILIVVLAIAIPLLVYGAGIMALPTMILMNYQGKRCDPVLTLNKVYASLYPKLIRDATLSAPVQECEAYTLATSQQEKGSWQEAYQAYQDYSSIYPNGLYATESHQQSGAALFHLAQDETKQKDYEAALANLDLIVARYSDTGVINDAWNLYPSVYSPWGVRLREAGDFAGSEQVLNDFRTWSLSNQKTDSASEAQRELTKTYLDWGLDLQSQKQFEEAITKLDLAISADPQAQFDFTAKAKAGQSQVYVEWGNDLLEQEQFPLAIEKFELAISNSDGLNQEGADALANGQIQWAHQLSAGQDFDGALEHLALAKEAVSSKQTQESVNTALEDTYLAFSSSRGPQAQRAMNEALETTCEKHQSPDLPIFGLNQDSLRVGIYGVEQPLPEGWPAQTPGEMHYIACVVEEQRTVGTGTHYVIVKIPGNITAFNLPEYRIKIFWHVRLLKVDTAEELSTQVFEGSPPPPFPSKWADFGNGYFYGKPPLMSDIAQWFQTVLK